MIALILIGCLTGFGAAAAINYSIKRPSRIHSRLLNDSVQLAAMVVAGDRSGWTYPTDVIQLAERILNGDRHLPK